MAPAIDHPHSAGCFVATNRELGGGRGVDVVKEDRSLRRLRGAGSGEGAQVE
jgi:hypothetical protein